MKRRVVLWAAAASTVACTSKPPESTGDFAGPSVERGHALRTGLMLKAPNSVRKTGALVLGGGVAGVAALRELHAQGVDAALLELEPTVGGNARAHILGGLACPMGAHYLPVPDARAPEVQALLVDLGLAQFAAGRFTLTQTGERHLCHSPQERVWHNGHWQDGLLPLADAPASTIAQVQQFAKLVDAQRKTGQFVLPVLGSALGANRKKPDAELDSVTFAQWLTSQNLNDPTLRQYLDYCCKDDYGAGTSAVSAWAGLHYFASRHGFSAPGLEATHDSAGVLTWPQGNAWLVQQMAAPLTQHIHTGLLVARVAQTGSGIEVDAIDANGQIQRWQAPKAVLALPLRVAARVLENPPEPFVQLAKSTAHSAWIVSNLLLAEPLETAHTQGGAAPAWDNVVFASNSLGYVDASHQHIAASPSATGPRVLTHYRALGAGAQAAKQALETPWQTWREQVLAELHEPHPDLPRKLQHTSITRYGHAMSVPTPGTAHSAHSGALAQLAQHGLSPRLAYAHSDLAGYSVFEEALTAGVQAARRVAKKFIF